MTAGRAAAGAWAVAAAAWLAAGAPAPRGAGAASPPPDPCAPNESTPAAAPGPPAAEPGEDSLRAALRAFDAAAGRGRRARRWDWVVAARANQAAIYNHLGLPARAEAPAAEAVGLLDSAARVPGADPLLAPVARAIFGETLQSRSRPRAALAQYDSGLAAADAAAPPAAARLAAARARLCNDRGLALLEVGEVDSAAHYLARALAARRRAGDREGEAVALNNQARLLQTVGLAESSLVVIRAALALRRGAAPNAPAAALLHNNAGYAHDLLGQPAEALAAYERARQALGDRHPSLAGLTLLNRARARLALGEVGPARRDLDSARALERLAGDEAGEAWVLHDLGRAHLARGEWDAAEARLDSARRLLAAAGDRLREGSALYYLGAVHQGRARAAGGADALRRAADAYAAAAAARRAIARTAARDDERVVLAEQDVALTARWVLAWVALGAAGARDAPAAALAAAEEGRARALLDLLAAARPAAAPGGGAPPAPARAGPSAALSYLVTDSALVTWLALPDGRLLMDCARVPRAAVQALVRDLRGYLQAQAVDSGPRVARRATPFEATTPAPAAGCRDAAPPSAADRASRGATAAALARLLVPPPLAGALAAALPPGGDLVVVPHGVLALVPFAALPAPAPTRRPAGGAPPNGVPPDGAPPDGAPPNGAPARGEPLGVRYALRYAPSLAVLAALDPAPAGAPGDAVAAAAGPPAALAGRAALVVGDPAMPGDPDADGDPFAPLPEAGRTADWLGAWLRARPLTGARATREAVLGALGDAALVHLGTHGRAYAGERVRESFVALAPGGARGGGLLRVADLLAAPPLRAELVALTACQTGLGDVTDAEGTVGFQRALLARGARGALLTLWQVPAAESDTLVRRFYRHWLGAGVSKGEALRRAQAELRADRLRLARGDEAGDAANPYYWAGFQLVGGR